MRKYGGFVVIDDTTDLKKLDCDKWIVLEFMKALEKRLEMCPGQNACVTISEDAAQSILRALKNVFEEGTK